jgi:hypothetical protein
MSVVIGLFVVAAMAITLGATIVTNVKIWGLVKEFRLMFRRLTPAKRRSVLTRLAAIYAVVLAEGAIVLTAPFGVRKTLTYFVILPFVVLMPVAIIAAGVRGFRGQRHRRPPST